MNIGTVAKKSRVSRETIRNARPDCPTIDELASAFTWFAMDPGFRTIVAPPEAPSIVPKDEFQRRVRAYLLEHPDILVEAMQRLEARQRAVEASEAETALKARADEVFHDPASPVGGNLNGNVTLVEFFDYNCFYCRSVAPVMVEVESADPQLRIVYKEFPILGPNSLFAAKAALAAHQQGRYVEFHKALMGVGELADVDSVLAVAAETGLDAERLKKDMEDPAITNAINRNLTLARALRITGTPGFVVGNQILRSATNLKTLQAHINQARTAQ